MHYGVADRIEFILCDFVSFARSLSSSDPASRPLNGIDVVFLSPPWGGIEYLSMNGPSGAEPAGLDTPLHGKKVEAEEGEAPVYPLSALKPLHGKELFQLARGITQDVVSSLVHSFF